MPEQLTPHFRLSEFVCPCCGKVDPVTAMAMAEHLELIRPDIGPILIRSSFRCPRHNSKLGGRYNSFHLLGLAVDFFVTGDSHRYRAIKSLLAHDWRRIGIGKDIIHADHGPTCVPVIWTYY